MFKHVGVARGLSECGFVVGGCARRELRKVALEQGDAVAFGPVGTAVTCDGIDGTKTAVLDRPAMSARFTQPVTLID